MVVECVAAVADQDTDNKFRWAYKTGYNIWTVDEHMTTETDDYKKYHEWYLSCRKCRKILISGDTWSYHAAINNKYICIKCEKNDK